MIVFMLISLASSQSFLNLHTLCSSNIKFLVVPPCLHCPIQKTFCKVCHLQGLSIAVSSRECISFYLTPVPVSLSGHCFQEALPNSLPYSSQTAVGFFFFSCLICVHSLLLCVIYFFITVSLYIYV